MRIPSTTSMALGAAIAFGLVPEAAVAQKTVTPGVYVREITILPTGRSVSGRAAVLEPDAAALRRGGVSRLVVEVPPGPMQEALATGRRVHKPLKITVELEAASGGGVITLSDVTLANWADAPEGAARLELVVGGGALAARAGAMRARAGEPAAMCPGGGRLLGNATYVEATGSDALPKGRHEIRLCSDGTSNTILIGEKRVPARLEGCPSDVAEAGLGPWEVNVKQVLDGSVELSMRSPARPGCTAASLLIPSVISAREAANKLPPEAAPPPRSGPVSVTAVPPATKDAFDSIWMDLGPPVADALERRLDALARESEAARDLRPEWQRIAREHPDFARLSERLTRELGRPGGPADGAPPWYVCYILSGGNPFCVVLVFSPDGG
jgi:hypothetical protein